MRFVLEAGTDAASLALFDPAVIPSDYDLRFAQESIDLIEELERAGDLIYFELDGDGSYFVHLFVDEPIVDELRTYAAEPPTEKLLRIASGQAILAGAEYIAPEGNSRLEQYPHMGATVDLPRGTYRAIVYEMNYPDELEDKVYRASVSSWQKMHLGLMGCLAIAAIIALCGGIVAVFKAGPWRWEIVTACVLVFVLPFVLARTRSFQSANQASREVAQAFPTICVELKRI